MYVYKNVNPNGIFVGDCVVRAIATALHRGWKETYLDLCYQGLLLCDMPSSNKVWKTYLQDSGFVIGIIPNTCPDCYTIAEFARDNPNGTYILGTGTHAVAVIDGDYYDTWDSGSEVPIFYLYKEV